jgi:hypothetical protein
MNDETTVKLGDIFKNARKALRSGNFPNHDAFTFSEVIGAALALPKEFVIHEIIKEQE